MGVISRDKDESIPIMKSGVQGAYNGLLLRNLKKDTRRKGSRGKCTHTTGTELKSRTTTRFRCVHKVQDFQNYCRPWGGPYSKDDHVSGYIRETPFSGRAPKF